MGGLEFVDYQGESREQLERREKWECLDSRESDQEKWEGPNSSAERQSALVRWEGLHSSAERESAREK